MRCEKDSASAAGFADGGRGRHANECSCLWELEKARKQSFSWSLHGNAAHRQTA